MERNVKIVCCIVAVLALLLAATGFASEGTRITGLIDPRTNTCPNPRRSPAFGLGITSAVCLIVAQFTISIASKCTCCCSRGPQRSSRCWTLAVVFFVVSWFASLFASLILVAAAILNGGFISDSLNSEYCFEVRSGVFAGMTTLGLISLGMALTYYIILSSASKALLPTSQPEMAMGQPQFPPKEGV